MDTKRFVEWVQALELVQVTITATIDSSGRLGAVGGLWLKLLAAAEEAAKLGLLRMVVVAEDQPNVPTTLEQDDASPFRILRAATLQEAVGKLYDEYGPREAVRRHEREQCASIDLLGRAVPLEKYYQLLPLLREVKRERLPHHSSPSEREDNSDPRLQLVDILRWEEELREERVTYERVSVEQVFNDFQVAAREAKTAVPRFVVLGPPGSGKTTLEQYLGWQAANRRLHVSGRSLLPARVRLREWEAWATKNRDPQQSLSQYLTERYKDLSSAPRAVQWRRWLQRGEVLLLLDGLDEIAGKPLFMTALKAALTTFSDCPIVLTCRTVSFEQHRTLCADFPIFTLAGLDNETRDAYIRAFPAEHGAYDDPDVLIDRLKHTPHLRPLAANPLLLSVICYVVDDSKGVILPATHAALYKTALEKLLTRRPQRVEVVYPGEEPDIDEKLAILERTALNLFVQEDRKLIFTGEELAQKLKQALSKEGYGEAPAPWANALRADLTLNSGILRGSAAQGSFFLHLTVQEFLVAAAIARVVNEKGWETPLEIAGATVSMHRLVDRKAWDPRWQEVIMLLAGQLRDPAPLLTLLADEKKDDVFRYRLALAALCLPEIRLTIGNNQSALVDRITTATFSCWLRHERNGTDAAVPHLTRVLSALGQVNGRMEGTPLLQWLCQRLHDANRDVRSGATKALGQIGEGIAQHPEVLSALVTALHDKDELVRSQGARALGQMGAAAVPHPDVPPALLQAALHDKNWFVRAEAAKALEHMGAAAVPHPDVLPALAQVRRDRDKAVRSEAVEESERMRAVKMQHLHMLPALVTALYNEDRGVRAEAVKTLEQMGAAAVQHPDVLPALVQVALHDKDGGVRARATDTLGRMGTTATQHPYVLPTLVQVTLHDKDGGVRARAAKALGQIGETVARRPEVLPALVAALRDEDGDVRFRAAEALGQIMAQGVRVFRRLWGKVEGKRVEELANL
jgi:HEAT repeat protein